MSTTVFMSNTIYITRNGLLEPLGQSQVMSYLRGLSRDHSVSLITFEKAEDLADHASMARAQADCAAHGIEWHPQRFRRCPRLIAPAWGQIAAGAAALRLARSKKAKLIHGRSYLPAAVAWAVWRLTGTPFIFDMRALWPEELITAGRLRRGSLIHHMIQHIERVCLRDAAGIVSLTEAAVAYLKVRYPRELAGKNITVIPTCADLERFTPPTVVPKVRVYGCVGTVLSGWFKLEWLSAFFQAVARHDPDAHFEVVTRDDANAVRAQLDPESRLPKLSIFASTPQNVPNIVRGHSISAMFFTEGTSKLGSAPTRLGEVLGCGLPVVANEGVGDVADIIRRYRVGVITRDCSDRAMDEAVKELVQLRKDPELSLRCRRAAEEVFSLNRGTEAYRALYKEILGKPRQQSNVAPGFR